jgi:ATP-dependent helicase/nuclease subunit A
MVSALKSMRIPVAGADRMTLTSQLAVMDLMALGDALLLPEDDLTLAALLKSPIFGLSDDDLFTIGHGRTGSLWAALAEKAGKNSAYADAIGRLEAWRADAVRQKPFDFYMKRLECDGVRGQLLNRLGPDAADAIDEFVNLGLTYEQSETPTLQEFLHWLRIAEPQIKRDMDAGRDEVRVMTVHGSKGLEANIVFLADTCSARSASRGGLTELPRPPSPFGRTSLPVWALPGARLVPAIQQACDDEQQAEREEYRRLLYVAMTRARDRLYVTGFEGKSTRDKNCWYDLICDSLAGRLSEGKDHEGRPVLRMECSQDVPPKETAATIAAEMPGPLPVWHAQNPAVAPMPAVVNPSRLDLPYVAGMSRPPSARPRSEALLRGRLVHRLLEQLPQLPPEKWGRSGAHFLAAEGKSLSTREGEQILAEIVRILKSDEFGGLFGPQSRAEVPVAVDIGSPDEDIPPIRISGQIDRLLIRASEAVILDFKTGQAVAQSPDEIPQNYLVQLAAYRLAVSRVIKVKKIQTALLWTEKPLLMAVPEALLEKGERLLYESLRSRHLDNSRRAT